MFSPLAYVPGLHVEDRNREVELRHPQGNQGREIHEWYISNQVIYLKAKHMPSD